jgi:glutathione S-transferase
MAQIKLYQFSPLSGQESASPFCVKVHYALRYKKLDFEVKNVGTPIEARKLNPAGKLPVLTYDGVTITDSTDIISFLESRHREPLLYPPDRTLRSRALMLEDWADESLYWHVVYERWLVKEQFDPFAAILLAGMPRPLRPVIKSFAYRQTRRQLIGQGLGRLTLEKQREKLSQALGWLDDVLDGGFLCGQDLTIADIGVAAQVAALTIALTPFAAGEVSKRNNLTRWLERVRQTVG